MWGGAVVPSLSYIFNRVLRTSIEKKEVSGLARLEGETRDDGAG